MRVQRKPDQSVKPQTFARVKQFHDQLQEMAKAPAYSFIYNPKKVFYSDTDWLEKKTVLGHTAWNITSGYICLHLYVAAGKNAPEVRTRDSEANRRRFSHLLANSRQIESAFGHELIWQEDTTSAGLYQASVLVFPTNLKIADDFNEAMWPMIQEQLLTTAKRLNDVISPYLDRIKQAERLASNPTATAEAIRPSLTLPTEKPRRAQTPPDNLQTAETAENLSGEKLYQKRARQALPILVRQAHANQTIFYSDLAQEMGMPNERNLNYVLGSIGKTLLQLSDKLNEKIPPIQCVVVNRQTGLPGEGIGWFMDKVRFSEMLKDEQTAITKAQLELVYQYPKWLDVLENLELKPLQSGLSDLIAEASKRKNFGAVESEPHKRLKNFIAANPTTLGLPASTPDGQIEFDLLSGDTVDVMFKTDKQWTAVEVKSHISPEYDLIRGLYQCVKYRAVLKAFLSDQYPRARARTVLVVGKPFPESLIPLRNLLGIEVQIHQSS